jgi:assimilatory nitrate reductase catalytic subunit
MNILLAQLDADTQIQTIKTTCPYCGVGCGVLATVDQKSGEVTVKGDPEHPANFGRLCSKGSALGETLSTQTRLSEPMVDGAVVDWETALGAVAHKIGDSIQQHGPDSVMFYVSGQLLTEDYYVANKLIKGFIGTNNIDSNSRLCMSSAVAAHKRAFGSDTVPVNYEDLEACELLVLVGSNMAWCHPVLFQRVKAAFEAAAAMGKPKKLVVIDPRRTDSCSFADLHLGLKIGTDTHLFNGLLNYLGHEVFQENPYQMPGWTDQLEGLDAALEAASEYTVDRVAEVCGLEAADVLAFYRLFSSTPKTLSAFCMGVNQSSSGTDKANAIINAHLITGRIGSAGAGPFSLTGQPNAMGGREVGALSNLLAAHFDLSDADSRAQVAKFWRSPKPISPKVGLSATEVAGAIKRGEVRVIWIMATNPVVSLTQTSELREALELCNTVIVSDCVGGTATQHFADILLPAQGWSEKSGTATNSERRISRQRRLLPPHKLAKPDWWILSKVAQKLGFYGFEYTHESQIFEEHAKLSNQPNDNASQLPRSFQLGALAQLSIDQYDALAPIQWPVSMSEVSGIASRFYSDGKAHSASGKLKLIPITPRLAISSLSADYPLMLSTGRIRDQWHTMTRTGLSARLNQHITEAFVQVHPSDAEALGLTEAGLAHVNSVHGEVLLRVSITDQVRAGEVFAPMHWSEQSANACVGKLIQSNIDPISKQPEFKATPVSVRPATTTDHGLLLLPISALNQLKTLLTDFDYYSYRLLGEAIEVTFEQFARFGKPQVDHLLDQLTTLPGIELSRAASLSDPAQGQQRWVFYDQDVSVSEASAIKGSSSAARLVCVLYIQQREQSLPDTRWLLSKFGAGLESSDHTALLAGAPLEGDFDVGRIVCSCFTVGEKTICAAIKEQKLTTAEQIGAYLKAGTNCGSCVPELKELLKAEG